MLVFQMHYCLSKHSKGFYWVVLLKQVAKFPKAAGDSRHRHNIQNNAQFTTTTTYNIVHPALHHRPYVGTQGVRVMKPPPPQPLDLIVVTYELYIASSRPP